MVDDVTLRLFGRFRAAVDGAAVPEAAWHGHRSKAVVKLLALAPDHQLHRGQLLESLWPELDPDAAGANLRKAVHFARRALPPSALRVRDAVVSLESIHLWVDVDAFEAAVAMGDLDRAIDLYADGLLVEDRYEPWVEEYRAQLRSRLDRMLLRSGDRLLEQKDFRRAAQVFDRLLGLDPLDEAAAAGLMRSSASSGQPSAALSCYREFQARLVRDTGTQPSESLRRLRDRIAARDRVPLPAAVIPRRRTGAGDVTERKLVTVVVLDAAPATGVDPEVMARDLESWASLATDVFGSWNGSCDRLLAGEIMAVFGVPRLHEDDAGRALRACLELQARTPLPMRMGVATGEVVVRADPAGLARGITGEAVGAASRLREAGGAGRITVAERTCRLATRFRFGDPTRLGDDRLADLWGRALLGHDVDGAEGGPPVDAPMVGRDAERATVVEAFAEAARSGSPRFATILGPAGIGKSRLLDEALAAIVERRPTTRVLRGRCLPAAHGGMYSALGEILCRACGIVLTDPVSTVQTRLRQGLRAMFGRDELSETTLTALAASIGVAMPGTAIEQIDPRTVADELSRAWPRFATAIAGSGPAVVAVEDLHWAGDELLDALASIATGASRPVLFLATARPELLTEHAAWVAGLRPAVVVELHPLAEQQSRTLLAQLRAASSLSLSTRQRLLARAEGNPFFLQELVRHAARDGAATLPDTISAVLAARLDGLPPEDKRVLQQAAVVGRVFWAEPLTRGEAGTDVGATLDRLTREGFVERRRRSTLPGHSEYAFRHALTHEVTYASTPRGARARAHARIATWIEETAGSRREDLAELLAFHWAVAAGDEAELAWSEPSERENARSNAVRWLIRAGDLARARFAAGRAVELHEQALALGVGAQERAVALEALGRDHDAAFDGEEAVRRYQEALAIARTDQRLAPARARLCRRIAWLMATSPGAFAVTPDPRAVEALVAEGLAAVEDEIGRAWLLLVHGISARLWRGSEPFGQGDRSDPVPIEQRIHSVETALRVGRAQGRPELVLAAERALKILYGIAGRYREAVTLARRHLAVLSAARSTLEQADLLREASVHAVLVDGDFEQGLALARRCSALSTGSNPHQLMHATWGLLVALYHLGRWDELQAVADDHMSAYRAAADASGCQFVGDGPLIAATVLAHRGDLGAARALAAEAGDPVDDVEAAGAWQASFALARGDAAAARRIATAGARRGGLSGPQHALCLVEALVALEDWPALDSYLPAARVAVAGNALLGPVCRRATSLLDARAGRLGDAQPGLLTAIGAFEAMRVPFEAARTRELLAALLPPRAAREHLAAARATYRQLRAVPHGAVVAPMPVTDRPDPRGGGRGGRRPLQRAGGTGDGGRRRTGQ